MTEIQVAMTAIKLYAEMHPRPTQVTQVQAAEMLGISRHTVRSLINAGTIKLNACGLIPIESVDSAREARAS